jgi:hypothetical protein
LYVSDFKNQDDSDKDLYHVYLKFLPAHFQIRISSFAQYIIRQPYNSIEHYSLIGIINSSIQ